MKILGQLSTDHVPIDVPQDFYLNPGIPQDLKNLLLGAGYPTAIPAKTAITRVSLGFTGDLSPISWL